MISPLEFHEVCGETVELSHDKRKATRTESFCRAVLFTSRPVQVGEHVSMKLLEVTNTWNGAIRFGFTAHDPTSFATNLPKYVCPDLTMLPGNWAKALHDRALQERGNVVFYYVTENGEAFYGVNGHVKTAFLSGIDVSKPLWGVIDLYGNTQSIEIVDTRLNNGASGGISVQALTAAVENIRLEASRHFPNVSFHGLRFCDLLRNERVALSEDATVAKGRPDAENAFAFTGRSLQCGECLVIRVESTAPSSNGFGLALTTCPPQSFVNKALPKALDDFMEMPEYGVAYRGLKTQGVREDELCFMINSEGEFRCRRNKENFRTLFHVDVTQRFYLVFDLNGTIESIRILGVTTDIPDTTDPAAAPEAKPPAEAENTDCCVCQENAINSVIYDCGHMCMCYDCAIKVRSNKESGCPLCRKPIKDVIRIYRP